MMKWALVFICSLFFVQPVFAYEFDFKHSKSSGKLLVIGSFDEIGKSNVSIEAITKLLEENTRLTRENKDLVKEVERLKARLEKLDDRLKTLERKVK